MTNDDLAWEWIASDPRYSSGGNPGQLAVNGGLTALVREAAQNSSDAALPGITPTIRFSLIRLDGQERDSFLEALQWPDVEGHIEAMTTTEGATLGKALAPGLASIRGGAPLILLRIADVECEGMTGPDVRDTANFRDEESNFFFLCRSDLFSGKSSGKGGSWGLGKSVYWRFSSISTAIFNSQPNSDCRFAKGRHDRLFGVIHGSAHDLGNASFAGRAHFGILEGEFAVSAFQAEEAAAALHASRTEPGSGSGTSVVIVGFHDPSQPGQPFDELAGSLKAAFARDFWPAMARETINFELEVIDGGETTPVSLDPTDTYTELTLGLLNFYDGTTKDSLVDANDVVARDMQVTIPKRIQPGSEHPEFVHTAKLLIVKSDGTEDDLENRTCLVRKPGMVVETLEKVWPGTTYHAVLLAGEAVAAPGDEPTEEQRLADDFLRAAEPPSHDRWIPRHESVPHQLDGVYAPPWKSKLQGIAAAINTALIAELGGSPPEGDDDTPRGIMDKLKFLRRGSGGQTGRISSPRVAKLEGSITPGDAWSIKATIRITDRPTGWSFDPALVFAGADSGGEPVAWSSLRGPKTVSIDAATNRVNVPSTGSGRPFNITLTGTSDPNSHPIPAREAGVQLELLKLGQAVGGVS
jgi:hypothetical protein